MKENMLKIQDRSPNFRENDKLFIVRCFCCNEETGQENWAPAVAGGYCAWCGWSEEEPYFHDYKEGTDL